MKRKQKYPDQVSFLAVAGTLDFMRALAYYRGKKGVLGDGAREVVARGIAELKKSFTDKDLKRFEEILESVKLASVVKSSQ